MTENFDNFSDQRHEENQDSDSKELSNSSEVSPHRNSAREALENRIKSDTFFSDFFNDEDEESTLLNKTPQDELPDFTKNDQYGKTERAIRENIKELRKLHPMGGVESFQILNSQILLEAPADFFERFEVDAQEATNAIQSQLSESGRSDLIAIAQANQDDEAAQDAAFRSVQAVTLEYLERTVHKGIDKQIISYMIISDILWLSRLEPLWRDTEIDEILCNGPYDVQVEIKGMVVKVPSCKFRNPAHLEALIERLYGAIGRSVTQMTPSVAGRLHDKSRLHAVHRSVAPEGPNFSIRRHPDKFWTPTDLIELDTASQDMLTELGNLILKGCSFLVVGGTGTGKTTTLNALSCFFSPNQRIITLEDNLELKLNPHKLLAAPMESRPPNRLIAGDEGITMRELVKTSLRLRPDGIIIGEVRDGSAWDLCQALNTGHWGASTLHANSEYDAIYRLQSLITQAELILGDATLPLIATAFDFIVLLSHFPEDGTRKITSISEIDPYPSRNSANELVLETHPLWEFENKRVIDDKVVGDWVKKRDISDVRRKRRNLDLIKDKTWEELMEIAKV